MIISLVNILISVTLVTTSQESLHEQGKVGFLVASQGSFYGFLYRCYQGYHDGLGVYGSMYLLGVTFDLNNGAT